MSKQITIRMPQPLLDKWLAALRSGEYRQARGALKCNVDGGNCCLGVLQMVASGEVETYGDGEPRALPTAAWLREQRVEFSGRFGAESPLLPTLGEEAHQANDTGRTFPEIADAIEACAEGY